MYNVLICDDQPSVVQKVNRILRNEYNNSLFIFSTEDPRQVLVNKEMKPESIDILLIDIEMQKFNGIDIAFKLRELNPRVQIIFISAYHKYAQDIFAVDPTYYLQKPLELPSIKIGMQKAFENLEKYETVSITFMKNGRPYTIPLNNILYLESSKRQIIVHTINDSLTFYGKLSSVQDNHPIYFCRCHQSYLVNYNCIKALDPNAVTLKNGITIPVSQSKYSEVKKNYQRYLASLI